jgi:hypothetical protein
MWIHQHGRWKFHLGQYGGGRYVGRKHVSGKYVGSCESTGVCAGRIGLCCSESTGVCAGRIRLCRGQSTGAGRIGKGHDSARLDAG